jgi:plasmid stabilization system protein ParE
MARLRFTARAESDLDSIAAHTLAAWGIDQTLRYLGDARSVL